MVFEQTAVSIDGVELFVLPSFTIPDITTDGFKGEIPIPGSGGESDKPEDESDKPGRESDSDKTGREGESDKPGDESDKPGREGDSDKPGREGESDKPDDESDKSGREDESDKPGASNKPEQSGPDNKTEPSGASNKPEPSGASNKTEPSGASNKPEPSGASNKPEPSGASNKTEPSGASNKLEQSGASNKPEQSGASNKPGIEGESDSNVEDSTLRSGELNTNSTEEQPISQDEAEERAQISLSFRQLNGFSFNKPTLTFNFYGLTTQSIEKDHSIVLVVHLLTLDGAEADTTDIECKLQQEVNVEDGKTLQANFKCEKSELEGDYIGLKLVSSNDVAGIPINDDTLLNPKLTEDAIAAGLMKNCTADPSVPPIFDAEKVGK